MIILFIILLYVLPDVLRAEDRRQAAEDLQRRQAEKAAAAAVRQAAAEDRRRAAEDRKRAEAEAVIEFYLPRRRDLLNRIERERNPDRRDRLEEQLFRIDQRLNKAYFDLTADR